MAYCPNCGREMVRCRADKRLAACGRDPGCSYLVAAFTRAEIRCNLINRYGLAVTTGKRRRGRLLYKCSRRQRVGLLFVRDAEGFFWAIRKTKTAVILDKFLPVPE